MYSKMCEWASKNQFAATCCVNECTLPAAQTPAVMFGFSLLIVLYCALVAYFAVGPNRWPKLIRRGRSTTHTLFLW